MDSAMNPDASPVRPSLSRRIAWKVSAVLQGLHEHPEAPPKPDAWRFLGANVLEVRDLACLKAALRWSEDPVLGDAEYLSACEHLTDLNERRRRDAEVVGAACRNGRPRTLLEIGTGEGQMTAVMAENAPDGEVHTINIPPEEITEGGKLVTRAVSRDDIGFYYRNRGCRNVRQIFVNTLRWKPELGPIDVAFIDGCHDADFVYQDTVKVLSLCRRGSIVLWHDFNPELIQAYEWICGVCAGVERLYREGVLRGPILHVRDSWIGLYRV